MNSLGKYRIKNIKKYKGNYRNVIYRSSWERKFMIYCDSHPSIIQWSSEEMSIPYVSPIDKKTHRYFPDFVIKKVNSKGEKQTLMIEIKPSSQTSKPKMGNKKSRFIKENITWQINNAKWKAAENFCQKYGWKFKILTEKELKI